MDAKTTQAIQAVQDVIANPEAYLKTPVDPEVAQELNRAARSVGDPDYVPEDTLGETLENNGVNG
jgi:hypothetical protein